jgi:hypothetical protein
VFRYFTTVKVTAAVRKLLSSMLAHLRLCASNWQTSDHISPSTSLRSPVFLINSSPFLLLLPCTVVHDVPSSKVTELICRVPSKSFIRSLCGVPAPTCVGLSIVCVLRRFSSLLLEASALFSPSLATVACAQHPRRCVGSCQLRDYRHPLHSNCTV